MLLQEHILGDASHAIVKVTLPSSQRVQAVCCNSAVRLVQAAHKASLTLRKVLDIKAVGQPYSLNRFSIPTDKTAYMLLSSSRSLPSRSCRSHRLKPCAVNLQPKCV